MQHFDEEKQIQKCFFKKCVIIRCTDYTDIRKFDAKNNFFPGMLKGKLIFFKNKISVFEVDL